MVSGEDVGEVLGGLERELAGALVMVGETFAFVEQTEDKDIRGWVKVVVSGKERSESGKIRIILGEPIATGLAAQRSDRLLVKILNLLDEVAWCLPADDFVVAIAAGRLDDPKVSIDHGFT